MLRLCFAYYRRLDCYKGLFIYFLSHFTTTNYSTCSYFLRWCSLWTDNIWLKTNFFPYLPTHAILGHALASQNIFFITLTMLVFDVRFRRWGSRKPSNSRCFLRVRILLTDKRPLPLCKSFLDLVYWVRSEDRRVFRYSTAMENNMTHNKTYSILIAYYL
jgi:hypothetical protein